MSNKALYIPLIMALLISQAGLQTASGQNSGSQDPSEEGYYADTDTFDPTSVSMGVNFKIKDIKSMTPQAIPQNCQFDTGIGTTNRAGDAYRECTNCIYSTPVCGTYQNDYPHRMTVDTEQNQRILHIKSWAPWYDFAAGPIWYSCHFLVCN
jgi:hypothetical protein